MDDQGNRGRQYPNLQVSLHYNLKKYIIISTDTSNIITQNIYLNEFYLKTESDLLFCCGIKNLAISYLCLGTERFLSFWKNDASKDTFNKLKSKVIGRK